MNKYTVVNGNTAEVCEFDSHTTTKNKQIMKVKFLKNGKLFVVYTTNSQQILFSHKNQSECYEWIFKKVNYA